MLTERDQSRLLGGRARDKLLRQSQRSAQVSRFCCTFLHQLVERLRATFRPTDKSNRSRCFSFARVLFGCDFQRRLGEDTTREQPPHVNDYRGIGPNRCSTRRTTSGRPEHPHCQVLVGPHILVHCLHAPKGVQTMNQNVRTNKHLAMGVFRTTGSRPPSATTIRPNPPIIVNMWRLFTSGVFSKTPLKIAAKKNTSKGKAPRTIGFIGGPKRRTKSLHELMQESAAKPRNLRTPLRLPKQFITSSTTQEAALVTFREHPAAIAWFGLHPVIRS